jgi:hypothetical protein
MVAPVLINGTRYKAIGGKRARVARAVSISQCRNDVIGAIYPMIES